VRIIAQKDADGVFGLADLALQIGISALAVSSTCRERQEQTVKDLQTSVDVSMMHYKGGTANYLEVLDSQRSLFEAELTLAETEITNTRASFSSTRRSAAAGNKSKRTAAMVARQAGAALLLVTLTLCLECVGSVATDRFTTKTDRVPTGHGVDRSTA
jgi:hypothetical protein